MNRYYLSSLWVDTGEIDARHKVDFRRKIRVLVATHNLKAVDAILMKRL